MSKYAQRLYVILLALMVMGGIASNIGATKLFPYIAGATLPAGAILVPTNYICGDMLTEIYGFKRARKTILLTFLTTLIATLYFQLVVMLPAAPSWDGQEHISYVLSQTPRILIASFTAFIAGQFLNAFIMSVMKQKDQEKRLGLRCILSTLMGETADSLIFVGIAFTGILPEQVMWTMIIAQAITKTLIEIVLYFSATKWLIQTSKKHIAKEIA